MFSEIVQRKFKIASSVFQGFLKVLRICQGHLIETEDLSPECSKDAEKNIKVAWGTIQGSFKSVSKVL